MTKISFKRKGIFGYIISLMLAYVFAMFLSGRVGWLLLLIAALAPVISFLLTLTFVKNIYVECDMAECVMMKKEKCEMELTVYNRNVFPTPPVRIRMTASSRLKCTEKDYMVSVLPRHKTVFTACFTACFCGPAVVGVESVAVCDYMGLFTFELRGLDYAALRRNMAVIPDISDISLYDENIIKLMSVSRHSDDSEDTVEAKFNTFSGFPGYDNREYVPGDPLKRINWKQSARRDKLLVRLDDEMASTSVAMVLDSVTDESDIDFKTAAKLAEYNFYEEDDIPAALMQETVENALGIIRLLLDNSYTVKLYVRFEDGYVTYDISDENMLAYVRGELAVYSFNTDINSERFPKEISGLDNTVVYVTPYENAALYDMLSSYTSADNVVVYASLCASRLRGGVPDAGQI